MHILGTLPVTEAQALIGTFQAHVRFKHKDSVAHAVFRQTKTDTCTFRHRHIQARTYQAQMITYAHFQI